MSRILLESFVQQTIMANPKIYGQRVMNDPSFLAWFGRSKIVDKNGIPLMVVHATTKDFDQFDHSRLNSNTGITTNLLGFYFTNTPETADVYVSKNFDKKHGFKSSSSYKLFFLRIEKPYAISKNEYWRLSRMSEPEIDRYLVELKSKGFDGMIMPSVWRGDPSGRDFVIFDKSQAKNVFNTSWSHPEKFTEGKDLTFAKWEKPDIDEEIGEIERTADDLGIELSTLLDAVTQTGRLSVLTDQFWDQMENTDRPDSLEHAIELATEYQKDWEPIVDGFKTNSTLPAPIVIIKPDGIPHLVGGNTRLMFAKVMDIRPKIWLTDLRRL